MKSLEESIMDNIVAAVTSLMFSEDDAIHSEVKRNLVRAALRSGVFQNRILILSLSN